MLWSLPLGGQIRMGAEHRGQRAGGDVKTHSDLVKRKAALHHLHYHVLDIKNKSQPLRNTIWLPSAPNYWLHIIVILQYQGALPVCFEREMLSIFIFLWKPLWSPTATYWRLGNASVIIKASPKRAITPDSQSPHRPRSHQAAAFDSLKEQQGFGN